MKAKLHDGSYRDFRIGQALVGHAFVSIELTLSDFKNPRFAEWLRDYVYCRMIQQEEASREGCGNSETVLG